MSAGRRLFFGLSVPPALRVALDRAVEEVRPLAPRARWSPPDNFHLTLLFLGATEDARAAELEAQLAEVAQATPRFSLAVHGAGTFGDPRPRVLWADVGGDVAAAEALAARLHEATGVPKERPLRPHITLARARPRGGDAALAQVAAKLAERPFGPLPAERLILFESLSTAGGVRYQPLHGHDLANRH